MAPSENRVKAAQLWDKSEEELKSELERLKSNFVTLRTQKIAGGVSAKLNQIHKIRKSIARVLTAINTNQRHQLRLYYKNKKYLPLDLRPKQTRAIRRRLTKQETLVKRVTEKQRKRQTLLSMRNYAVKA